MEQLMSQQGGAEEQEKLMRLMAQYVSVHRSLSKRFSIFSEIR